MADGVPGESDRDEVEDAELEPGRPARGSSGQQRYVLYAVSIAAVALLGGLGCYLLVAFLNSRPVNLMSLAQENEQRIIEVLPYIGELLQETVEDMRDEYAFWQVYSKVIGLHPKITPEGARTLVRQALRNDNLIVRLERTGPDEATVSVAYLGYVTHRLELVSELPLESINVSGGTATANPARVAIIVDGLGSSEDGLERLLAIDASLTVSVLPGLPRSAEIVREARDHRFEVILHLPLEGGSDAPVSKGTLTAGMDDDTFRATFWTDLESVYGVVGINNHQGSTFTTDYTAMNRLMGLVEDSGLFFIDSRTSSSSVAERVAREHAVPTAANNLFLDNVDDEQYIETQMGKLMDMAVRRGSAIGICHVQKRGTMNVLARIQAELDSRQTTLVPVSALVH